MVVCNKTTRFMDILDGDSLPFGRHGRDVDMLQMHICTTGVGICQVPDLPIWRYGERRSAMVREACPIGRNDWSKLYSRSRALTYVFSFRAGLEAAASAARNGARKAKRENLLDMSNETSDDSWSKERMSGRRLLPPTLQ